jgi:hypothetical protein
LTRNPKPSTSQSKRKNQSTAPNHNKEPLSKQHSSRSVYTKFKSSRNQTQTQHKAIKMRENNSSAKQTAKPPSAHPFQNFIFTIS